MNIHRDQQSLANDLRRLLRKRSLDLGAWESIWRGAGCANGIPDDMSVNQLIAVIERVKQVEPIGKKSA